MADLSKLKPSQHEFRPGYVPKGYECAKKSKQTGFRCTLACVPGKDCCRFHGGRVPIKHGLHSKYKGSALGKLIEKAQNDPDLMNLERQAAILHALQTGRLSKITKLAEATDDDYEAVRKITDSLVKAIERYERVQRAPENWVPIALVGRIVDAFAQAINRHVVDTAARRAVLEALDRGMDLAAPLPPQEVTQH